MASPDGQASMSHIVIDARELRTSTGRYIERLLHYLQQIDNDHDYTVLLYPKDMDSWAPANPRFTKLSCPHKEFTFSEQIGMLRQLRSLQPDLVHFGMTQQPILYSGKTITTIHDLTTVRFRNPAKNPLIFTIKQQVYRGVIQAVARKSTAILTGSAFVKGDVVDFTGISPDKITVTHEAADSIFVDPEPIQALIGKQFIMYIGRPQPHKNLDRLIKAFALLKQNQPDLHLVLAGKQDALYKKHEQRVLELGIQDVVFTGFVSEGQLRWLYENCRAYVFPSLSEGFGLPGLEAMRHAAPVVSSNSTCLPEIYGDAAKYFEPLDVPAMADCIETILTDDATRTAMIMKGKSQSQKYSWRRMAEQTLRVYRNVLDD